MKTAFCPGTGMSLHEFFKRLQVDPAHSSD